MNNTCKAGRGIAILTLHACISVHAVSVRGRPMGVALLAESAMLLVCGITYGICVRNTEYPRYENQVLVLMMYTVQLMALATLCLDALVGEQIAERKWHALMLVGGCCVLLLFVYPCVLARQFSHPSLLFVQTMAPDDDDEPEAVSNSIELEDVSDEQFEEVDLYAGRGKNPIST